MILLKLFSLFFIIGAVSFGGGYAMIPLINEMVMKEGWLSEERFLDLIAISESTPGPIAVNMATFIGASQKGFIGAVFATLGVVLPSFIIILIISALFGNLLKYKSVGAFLEGVRPVTVGLIVAAAITMGITVLLSFSGKGSVFSPDYTAIVIFGIIVLFAYFGKKIRKKALSPIFLIILSAFLGMLFYSI